MSTVIQIQEPIRRPPSTPPAGFALWQLGFRPFYLLASGFGALSIALWALQFGGLLPVPYLQGPIWHAHEMLFGFALAVIVGFLFTAGRNWSNQPTPTGWPLAALALLWLAARVLVLTPYGWAAAAANVAFPLAAAAALARPFIAARNRRNYFFVGLLLLLAAAALCVHLQMLGVICIAGLGRHPAGAGRGAVHHGGDGRAGAADVHQQWRTRREGRTPCGRWRSWRWARYWPCWRSTCCSLRPRCWPGSPRSPPWRTWRAGCCGNPGPRCTRPSSGCCMRPTFGFPCTWACALRPCSAGCPPPRRPMR